MKIKEKIRQKLRNWLFGEEFQKIEMAEKEYEIAKNLYNDEKDRLKWHLDRAIDSYINSYKLADDCHKLVDSMLDVGTDVGFYSDDHSWAVVCIKGHPEYVKFIPLSHRDAQDVLDFLKRFRYSNRVVDSPFAFRDMVNHCIMENPFGK